MPVSMKNALLLAVCIAMPGLLGPAPSRAAGPVSPALERAMTKAPAGAPIPTWVFFKEKEAAGPPALRKVEAGLTAHARERRARNRAAGQLVDAYDVPVSPARIEALRDAGVRIRHVSRWLNAVSVDATAPRIRDIAAWPEVSRVDIVRASRAPEPLPATQPSDRDAMRAPSAKLSYDYGNSLTQNTQINVPAMHDLGYHGEGVLIAVLDTGFNNLAHPALSGLDILATYDFVNLDTNVADEAGQMGSGHHGMLVLGALAAFAPGQVIGPAFGATFILAKTENTAWERHIEEDAWVSAAEWADSIGADIMTSSLTYLDGFSFGEPNYTWQEMDGATAIATIGADIAGSRGILIFNAAGNAGGVSEPQNTLGAPADADLVLTIGAVDFSGARALFSSVGNTSDGRIKPDLMAMGSAVWTTSSFDNTYVSNSGTSLATPLAAGAGALVMQARPGATNFTIRNVLRNTASNSLNPDRLYGWGILNTQAAMNAIPTGVGDTPETPVTTLVAYPNPFNPATTIEYGVAAAGRVTIVAYDAAGRRVATLLDETKHAGHHTVTWRGTNDDGRTLASGVYLLSLSGPGSHATRKVVLLK